MQRVIERSAGWELRLQENTENVSPIPGREEAGGIYILPSFSSHHVMSHNCLPGMGTIQTVIRVSLPGPAQGEEWSCSCRKQNTFIVTVLLLSNAMYLALTIWIIVLSIFLTLPQTWKAGIVIPILQMRNSETWRLSNLTSVIYQKWQNWDLNIQAYSSHYRHILNMFEFSYILVVQIQNFQK